MSVWRLYETRVDNKVDSKFGEPVRLVPWKAGSYSNPGMQDPAREAIDTIGIYVRPGAAIVGEGGTQGAGGLNTRIVTQDIWVSLTEDKLKNVASWVKGDRVFFPERNEWFEIAYPDLSATARPSLHLIRLQAASLLGGRFRAVGEDEEPEDSIIWNDEGGTAYFYDPELEEVVTL